MCLVHEWELVFPDGSRLPRYSVTPCPAGTETSPCAEYQRVAGPPRNEPVAPRFVEARPASSGGSGTRSSTSPPAGGLRSRRGANDIRLEFELHVPGTRRSHDGGSSSRSGSGRSSVSSTQYVRGGAIYSPPAGATIHPQYATRLRGPTYGEMSQWTPPPRPRIITVDPARATPPATPTPRRSRSAGPTAGREHDRSHSRPRSRRTASPPAPSPRRSTVSLESERAQQIRDLTEQIDRLVAEQDRARRLRDNDIRIAALTAQINELRRQRHPGRPILEVHQRGETAVRNPPRRPLHRAGDSLDTIGRRALQRDIDDGVRGGHRGGGGGAGGAPPAGGAGAGGANEARPPRPRRLTTGDNGGAGLEGLFRRPSRRREHIVFEDEPRHGKQRHR